MTTWMLWEGIYQDAHSIRWWDKAKCREKNKTTEMKKTLIKHYQYYEAIYKYLWIDLYLF